MIRKLKPTRLTRDAFKAYGDVIEATIESDQMTINEGHTTRYHDLASLDLVAEGGKSSISIFRSTPAAMPFTIKLMERHPLSSQAFYPLDKRPYLVVVAPRGKLNPGQIQVFLAKPDQGVNYHAGTWHHYSLALEETSDFLVVDRISDDTNCDEISLDKSDWVEIDMTDTNNS